MHPLPPLALASIRGEGGGGGGVKKENKNESCKKSRERRWHLFFSLNLFIKMSTSVSVIKFLKLLSVFLSAALR